MTKAWVRLKKYCELTGESSHSVRQRRSRGLWPDGVQSKIGPDGNIWINLAEADKWVEQGNLATIQKCRQA